MLTVSAPQRKQQAAESEGSMGFTQTSPVNPRPHGPAPLKGLATAQGDGQKQKPDFHASDAQVLLLPTLWLGFSWNEFVSSLKKAPGNAFSQKIFFFVSPPSIEVLLRYRQSDGITLQSGTEENTPPR